MRTVRTCNVKRKRQRTRRVWVHKDGVRALHRQAIRGNHRVRHTPKAS